MMTAALPPLLLLLWVSISSTLDAPAEPPSPLDFRYHNFSAMTEFLAQVNETSPDIARLYSIGKSVLKKELWVMELTAASGDALGVPHVKIVAGVHGNEAVGKELALQLIQFLADNYRRNDTVRWLLDHTSIHVLPSLNPDGAEFDRTGRSCTNEFGRANYRSIDLDRNFPDHFRPATRTRQPESDAVMAWLEAYPFSLSAALHGGDVVASYPFGNTPEDVTGRLKESSPSPDDDVFRHLASVYAASHRNMRLGRHCGADGVRYHGGISNAAAMGHVTGGMQDYGYARYGCMEITAHVSCCVQPWEQDLRGYWLDNQHALLNFLFEAHRGAKGVVVDGATGGPVAGARVWVDSRSIASRTSARGEFWKILLPGSYRLHVHKSGYDNLTASFAVHPLNGTTWLRLVLGPEVPSSSPATGASSPFSPTDATSDQPPTSASPTGVAATDQPSTATTPGRRRSPAERDVSSVACVSPAPRASSSSPSGKTVAAATLVLSLCARAW